MSKAKPSKKAITAAATAGGSAKAKKKKWSKGKTKDKANNAVVFEKNAYERVVKEATSYKVITPSYLVDRHHINCSLARSLLKELHAKGLIRKISGHHSQMIYARVGSDKDASKSSKNSQQWGETPNDDDQQELEQNDSSLHELAGQQEVEAAAA